MQSLAIGRRCVIIMWGHCNASNARGVTAGKMGRNSSINNSSITPKDAFSV